MNDISTEPGRRERKRLQQLDHLADTAWALFEAEGYEAVTMERIAAEARAFTDRMALTTSGVEDAVSRHSLNLEDAVGRLTADLDTRIAQAHVVTVDVLDGEHHEEPGGGARRGGWFERR